MHELRNQHGVNNYCVLFRVKAKNQNNNVQQRALSSFITIPFYLFCLHPTSNSENLEMGANGNEISYERFPKSWNRKRNLQSEPFKPKSYWGGNWTLLRTIIPGKKFPKLWITSRGCPCALSIGPKFPISWYGNHSGVKFQKIRKLVNFRKANRLTESSGNSGMKINSIRNFRKIRSKIWVYPTRLSSFSEILQIRDLLFSASSFGHDRTSRKDDGDAYSTMETLHFTCMSIVTSCS